MNKLALYINHYNIFLIKYELYFLFILYYKLKQIKTIRNIN